MTERGLGIPKEETERAASHFGIAPSEVTREMIEALPPRGTGLERGTARGLSNEEVNRIASAVVEKAREDVGIRDVIIGSAMGEGAIPLYGRETRREPCSCCLINPEGPNEPANRMCTTKSAIGTLKDSEEREWCSEINIVSDGRCERARSIREAARVCKEKHPEDTTKFFECYAPAFSKITKKSNPGANEKLSYLNQGNEIYDISFARRLQAEMMKEMRQPFRELLTPGKFPKRDEALKKLGKFTIAEVHGDGDLTIRSDDKLYVVTTEGKTFEQKPGDYVTIADPGKTTFKVGEVISREAFDKENERVKKLGERPATER